MLPPVVLVHGFLASPLLMTLLRRRLERSGRDVVVPHFRPLATGDVRTHAGELDRAVDEARHRLRADRVDVVGVSQGGLIALWWAQHRDGWGRASRLCTIGAPIRGTPAAWIGVPGLGAWSAGIWQLLPGSDLVRELAGPLPATARVTTIAMDNDRISPPEACAIDGARNVVLPGPPGPLTHQWLILSPAMVTELLGVLSPGG